MAYLYVQQMSLDWYITGIAFASEHTPYVTKLNKINK
jgi:hypothetical protein